MYSALRYQVQKAVPEERLANPATPRTGSLRPRCIRVVVAVVLAVGAWVGAATPALAASSTFGYSPSYQYLTVPSGVNSVHFDVIGGSGADGQGTYGAGTGGSGAEVTGDFSVSPGWVLKIWA